MDDVPRVVREAQGAGGLTFEELAEFVDEVRGRCDQGFEPGPIVGRVRFRAGLDRIEMLLSRPT